MKLNDPAGHGDTLSAGGQVKDEKPDFDKPAWPEHGYLNRPQQTMKAMSLQYVGRTFIKKMSEI